MLLEFLLKRFRKKFLKKYYEKFVEELPKDFLQLSMNEYLTAFREVPRWKLNFGGFSGVVFRILSSLWKNFKKISADQFQQKSLRVTQKKILVENFEWNTKTIPERIHWAFQDKFYKEHKAIFPELFPEKLLNQIQKVLEEELYVIIPEVNPEVQIYEI